MSSAAPWAHLVALAEHERDLVHESRWDELPAATAYRLSASELLGATPGRGAAVPSASLRAAA